MAELKEEYTDIQNRTHRVEHIIVPMEEDDRERLIEELFHILMQVNC